LRDPHSLHFKRRSTWLISRFQPRAMHWFVIWRASSMATRPQSRQSTRKL